MMKNNNGREETKRMGKAMSVIAKFFGLNKPTTNEILIALVQAGKSHRLNCVRDPGELTNVK